MKAELQQLEEELAAAEAEREELLARMPNPPAEDTPDGFTDEDAVEIRRVGEPPAFDFPAKDHLDLAQALGWIDMERAAQVSGSRFAYRIGDLALLELSLYRYALDRLVQKGFIAVLPPVLVREEAMYGTGFLPTDEVEHLQGRARRAVPHRHGRGRRSRRCTWARSSTTTRCRCATRATRRTSAARPAPPARTRAGCSASTSSTRSRCSSSRRLDVARDEHERLLAIEEELIGDLGLPYRVVNIAAGDLGASAVEEVRHRRLVPGAGALPRAHVDVEHDRLPGAPARHPHAPRRQARARRDAERHRGHRAHGHRAAGELPGRGRLGRAPRGALGIRRAADARRRGPDPLSHHPAPVLSIRIPIPLGNRRWIYACPAGPPGPPEEAASHDGYTVHRPWPGIRSIVAGAALAALPSSSRPSSAPPVPVRARPPSGRADSAAAGECGLPAASPLWIDYGEARSSPTCARVSVEAGRSSSPRAESRSAADVPEGGRRRRRTSSCTCHASSARADAPADPT